MAARDPPLLIQGFNFLNQYTYHGLCLDGLMNFRLVEDIVILVLRWNKLKGPGRFWSISFLDWPLHK